MKKLAISFFFFLLCFLNTAGGSVREKFNFNPDWKVFIGDDSNAKNVSYKDSKWKSVNLPSAFNQSTDTVAWYRKIFKVSSTYKGDKVFIEFEGAGQAAEVWVNGQRVGLHEDGVMAFGFDLTNYIKFGKNNIIAVRVDNSRKYKERATGTLYQWNDDSFNANYGGLTRNVFLHITDKLYQTLPLYSDLKTKGVYVYADNIDVKGKRAVLHIESEIRNDYDKPKTMRLNVLVRDNEKLLVREFQSDEVTLQPGETKVVTAFSSMRNVKFWSWGYGYLYEVDASIVADKKVVDMLRVKTGFRKTEFSNGIFKLNDRVLQLKGYAQRSTNEWPGVGPSIPAWLSDYSNNLMVEGNANLVRWMYVTPWKQDVESCDRIGLLETMPAGDREEDTENRMWEQRKEVMRDAIIYNRNNPSIIFYESGNKEISDKHMAEMLAIRNELDPKGGRAIGCRDMLDNKTAEYGGEIFNVNKSADKPVWTMEYCRNGAYRKYWDNESFPLHKQGEGSLNNNQDAFAGETVARWYDFWRERPGTGRRVNSGATSTFFSDSNILSRGSENFNGSGKVDAMRIKKDAWWADYVMWDGWVDPENIHTYIVGHWNYEKGAHKDVYVVSSGDQVELFLNNRSLGFGAQTNRFWFTFKNVKFSPGELRAVSYDKSKQKLSEFTCKTAGAPKSVKLNLIQALDGLHADGSDMVLVEVEVVDANGQRCPLANDRIDFEVKGPVDLIGSRQMSVEAGVNRILLRSTRKAGLVNIIARSGSLVPDSLNFSSKAVDVTFGLSSYVPGTKQPTSLLRGQTPLTSSFITSRVPVSLIDVSAGSNEADAFFSFDDNERTEWRSSGSRTEAWINYKLSRQAELSEICMKLSDWKNRSYQIRILNETGTVLWEGITETSYGYITLPLAKGVISNSVRVELSGAGKEKVVAASNLEAKSDKNIGSPENNSPKEDLRIIEIEFYESAE